MSEVILAALIVGIPALLTSVVSAWVSLRRVRGLEEQVQEVHISLNSRLSSLLEQTALASHAEGLKAGRDEKKPKEE